MRVWFQHERDGWNTLEEHMIASLERSRIRKPGVLTVAYYKFSAKKSAHVLSVIWDIITLNVKTITDGEMRSGKMS